MLFFYFFLVFPLHFFCLSWVSIIFFFFFFYCVWGLLLFQGELVFFFFCFLNHSSKQTYDTWRHRRVLPDDVIIADIGDQVLHIYVHGPVSTHKNGIGKTFTHTSIPFQLATLLKQRAKPSTHESIPIHPCTLLK